MIHSFDDVAYFEALSGLVADSRFLICLKHWRNAAAEGYKGEEEAELIRFKMEQMTLQDSFTEVYVKVA